MERMPGPVVSGQLKRGRLSHPADSAKTDETISGAEVPGQVPQSPPAAVCNVSGLGSAPRSAPNVEGRTAGRATFEWEVFNYEASARQRSSKVVVQQKTAAHSWYHPLNWLKLKSKLWPAGQRVSK